MVAAWRHLSQLNVKYYHLNNTLEIM